MPFAWTSSLLRSFADRPWRQSLLLATVSVVSGCASPGLSTAMFSADEQTFDTRTLARSQSDGDSANDVGDPADLSAAHADYGQRAGLFPPSRSKIDASIATVSDRPGDLSSGHSFVQPRIRMGRPIPLADEPKSIEPDAADRTPWATTSPLELFRPHSAGWQNAEDNKPAATTIEISPLKADETGFQSPLNQSEQLTDAATTDERPSAAGSQTGVTPVPTNSVEPTIPGDPQPELPEPSMLDRLRRGLATPALEDNADRVRRQLKRGLDPFGLLRDRDVASVPAAQPLAPETADTSVLPESPVTSEPSNAADTAATVQPAAGDAVQRAISELEGELASWPRAPNGSPSRPGDWRRRQSDLRLLYLIAGQPSDAVRVIDALPADEQEFWQSLMLAVNDYRTSPESSTATSDSSPNFNSTLNHLRSASRRLQPLSELTAGRAMFCERIDGFGQAVAFPSADFDPGQRVLIYTELQNFKSERTADGRFRSEFSATLEFLRDGDDEILDTVRVPLIADECDSERTDYFHSYEVTVPALSGRYQLRLKLSDLLSHQKTEATLRFNVR